MKRNNIFKYIILPLLLIITVATWYIYKEYNRAHKDTALLKPDYAIGAGDLINEFTGNEQSSNKKYWDKVIEVSGLVKEIKQDEKGFYSIALGDTASMSSVRCSVDSLHSKDAAMVIKGNTAVVKGICTGFNADELLGSDVILVRCAIESKKVISNN
jgi:hypothetical protein